MIRGSDGLDYEDLNARLLGEPADTGRNRILGPGSYYDETFKADYLEAYDRCERAGIPPWECHNRAKTQAGSLANERLERRHKDFLRSLANQLSARATRSGAITLYSGKPPSGSPGGAGGTDSLQAALATLCAAAESPIRRGLGPQGHLPTPGEVQRRRGEGSEPPADDPDAAPAREV